MTDYEPDHTDFDPVVARGFCTHCDRDVDTVKRDFGIGRYEFQGSKGIHRDERDCCSECGEEL